MSSSESLVATVSTAEGAARHVLIIGTGPAGLAAATAARQQGAQVTILDSSDQLGGQYWRHLPKQRPAAAEQLLHHGWAHFEQLRSALDADSGCRIRTNAHVWAMETGAVSATDTAGTSPGIVHVVVGEPDGVARDRFVLEADAIVLATGAHDRTLPFPGWDLPGVFTGGAAQALAKAERVAVGQRVVVAGAGPFLLPVAASLTAVGATVVGVFEANRLATILRGWLPRPWLLLPAASKSVELAGYIAGFVKHRIGYRVGSMVVEAHGTERVEAVTVVSVTKDWKPIVGSERRIEADAVCVSHGFIPRLELAIAAGCALTPQRFVTVGDDQQTSVAGVFAAGEITGIGGVDLALAEGTIAGHVAAGGSVPGAEAHGQARAPRAIRQALRRRRVFRGFAARIEAAHGIRGGWTEAVTPETIVCRCEEVSFGALCSGAQATGSRSLRSLKLSTRAGLGICQGRICGRSVEALLATQLGEGGLLDDASSDRRPIAVPLRLGELAAAARPTESLSDHN